MWQQHRPGPVHLVSLDAAYPCESLKGWQAWALFVAWTNACAHSACFFSFKMCKKYILAFGRFQSMWDWWISSSVSSNTSNLGVILAQVLVSWFDTNFLHSCFLPEHFFFWVRTLHSDIPTGKDLLGTFSTECPCDILCWMSPYIERFIPLKFCGRFGF